MTSLNTTAKGNFFSSRTITWAAGLSIAYLALSYYLIGFKPDQVYLIIFVNALYFLSGITRKLMTGLLIFVVFWVIFDYMKAFPNYRYGQVHIETLYNAEKRFFGIAGADGQLVTPNEFCITHSNNWLDVLTGIFYLSWVPVPIGFACFLFFRNRLSFLHFSLTFLLVNFIGFIIYYLYPATPPWYVQQHGFELIVNTPGNAAGLERFDQFFNMGIFKSIYGKSSNVFAAMPSLHASYPVIVLYHGIKNKLGRVNILLAIVMAGIWFSAIYNSHHYVLDVIAGILCAVAGILLFGWMNQKSTRVQKWIEKFAAVIA